MVGGGRLLGSVLDQQPAQLDLKPFREALGPDARSILEIFERAVTPQLLDELAERNPCVHTPMAGSSQPKKRDR